MGADDPFIVAMFEGLAQAELASDHMRISKYERQIAERRAQDLHRITLALESIASASNVYMRSKQHV